MFQAKEISKKRLQVKDQKGACNNPDKLCMNDAAAGISTNVLSCLSPYGSKQNTADAYSIIFV